MNLTKILKPLVLLEKKARGKPITGGDVGWMVDCKGTLFLKKVHLGHYLPNIPSPWALWGDVYGWKNIFSLHEKMKPELKEKYYEKN